ncbi:MarR family winged helix-turn-helix transcriptional regulator [Dermabacteraceae bacterium P13095]
MRIIGSGEAVLVPEKRLACLAEHLASKQGITIMNDASLEGGAAVLRYLILALQWQGGGKLAELLSPLGLTPSRMEALEVIGDHGPLTTSQVGGYLACESGSSSRLLKSFAEKGLTVRSTPLDNRRATLHVLTLAGKKLLEQVREVTDRFHAQILARMPSGFSDDRLRSLTE